jgi:hypothetical protein
MEDNSPIMQLKPHPATEKYMRAVENRLRRWPVTLAGLYLIGQAVLLFLLFPTLILIHILQAPELHLSMFRTPDGRLARLWVEVISLTGLNVSLHIGEYTLAIPSQMLTSLVFLFLALPVLLAGLMFVFPWRRAWMIAVLLQGVILTLALVIYFNLFHPYIYVVMFNAVFMVFILNQYDVEVYFQPRQATSEGEQS